MFLLSFFSLVPAARAAHVDFERDYCFAITDISVQPSQADQLNFTCGQSPRDYQRSSLWLTIGTADLPDTANDLSVMVQQSRFDALSVGFVYSDGQKRWQSVRNGDFGSHWRVGGQIKFEAPDREQPVAGVLFRFERLTDHGLLRVRFLPEAKSSQESAMVAAIVSGALALLLISFLYNLTSAVSTGQRVLLWQTSWAGVMIIWGLVWSQLHLILFPSLAGSGSAQASTLLATLAIALGVLAAIKPMPKDAMPKWMRHTNVLLAVFIALAGVPLTLIRESRIVHLDHMLAIIVVLNLLLVTASLVAAWRRGHRHGRDMLIAWSVPMAALAFISLVNIDTSLWSGGAKLVVLVASSWLALWTMVATTRDVQQLRDERDAAQREAGVAKQLAVRDPLTGLNNRRGFNEKMAELWDRAQADRLPMALILVDIDRFKSVNDRFGHDIGDHVLCSVAARIERWEGPRCTAARVGGEEFALFVVGLDGLSLRRFAEGVRRDIAECDLTPWRADLSVTASLGVAEARHDTDFQTLYRVADRALYNAKNAGRDRVAALQADAEIAVEAVEADHSAEEAALNH
jgi:diguanylate cyclase (GGDEF)-like protein